MTLENLMSHMGMGTKQLSDRYEHSAPMPDQHVYYAYEPAQPAHAPVATSKHISHGGGSHKTNASMSALTLLAFLFFLHILQQCIKDHMTEMQTTPIMVMSSREGDEEIPNIKKIDITGISQETNDDNTNMMKIKATEYTPKDQEYTHEDYPKTFKTYVNAMDDK